MSDHWFHAEDTVSEDSSTLVYEYAMGNHQVNEDPGYGYRELPRGGDKRLNLAAYFPTQLDRPNLEDPGPVENVFQVYPLDTSNFETQNPLPSEVDEGALSPTFSIGYAVGPFSATFVTWDMNGDHSTYLPNKDSDIEKAYWELPQYNDALGQDEAYGVSIDIECDSAASSGDIVVVECKSHVGWSYSAWISGGRFYGDTKDAIIYPSFKVV